MNQTRDRELRAICHCTTQHYELEDQDFGKLASKLREIASAQMMHGEKLADSFLFLNGEPTTKPDGQVKKGQKITQMLKTNIGLESEAIHPSPIRHGFVILVLTGGDLNKPVL